MSRLAECAWSWRDLATIHRLEYPLPITYLCYAFWGAAYATGDARQLLAGPVLLAGATTMLLTLAGLALNTAADVRTDERHREKDYLADAALRFGRTRILRLAAATAAAGLAGAAVLSAWTGRWAGLGLAVAMLALHVAYNVEPLRLKRRGLAGPVVIGLSVVGAPFLLAYGAARPGFEPHLWPVLGGVTILAIGRTVWWSVPDRAADIATGIGTPTVRYGVSRAFALAGRIMLAGIALLGWGLWSRFGAWVVPGIAAHATFLLWQPLDRARPSAVIMRRRGMSLVMTGEVALAVLPLVA